MEVLVALDDSPESRAALDWASRAWKEVCTKFTKRRNLVDKYQQENKHFELGFSIFFSVNFHFCRVHLNSSLSRWFTP